MTTHLRQVLAKEKNEEISRNDNETESKESEKTESETVKCDDTDVVLGNTSNMDDSAELVYMERYFKCFSFFYFHCIIEISDIC